MTPDRAKRALQRGKLTELLRGRIEDLDRLRERLRRFRVSRRIVDRHLCLRWGAGHQGQHESNRRGGHAMLR